MPDANGGSQEKLESTKLRDSAPSDPTRTSTSPGQQESAILEQPKEELALTAPKPKIFAIMQSSTESSMGFRRSRLMPNRQSFDSQLYVLVSYSTLWVDGKTLIQDQFLWPKANRDIRQMKMFAIDFLSDLFGRRLGDS